MISQPEKEVPLRFKSLCSIRRVRRRARQNQTLIARALELQREAVAVLQPGAMARTYAPSGRVSASADLVGSLRAAG